MKRWSAVVALAFVVVAAWGLAPSAYAATGGQAGPQVVTVGMFVENLSDVDLKQGSFQADFYLWFKWDGDLDPTKTYEFTNTIPLELSSVAGSTGPDGSPVPETLEDGSMYQVFHMRGRFLGQFDVDDYPLDAGRLLISIEDVRHDSSVLVYRPDPASNIAPTLRVNGWRLHEPVGSASDHRYATTFGYPGEAGDSAFSRLEFSVAVTRPGITLIVQTTFPLIVIILAALASLLIDSRVGDEGGDAHWWFLATRLSLAVPAVIAAVALQFSAAPGVPREGQVLLVDRIYLLSYAVILAVIAVTVFAHRILRKGGYQRAERLDRWSLFLLTPGYLGGILLILLIR